MKNLKYSAGAVSKGFWFQAFKKYNDLLNRGYKDKEIKEMQEKDNILLAPSKSYGKKMINEIAKRTKALPDEIKDIFSRLTLSDQKILNLLGIMMTDRLFFEFMYEVYREKIIIGNLEFDNSHTRIFLNNKSEQSERVANLTLQTKKRLSGAYRTYLKDAGLLVEEGGLSIIRKPILDMSLEAEMKNKGMYPYLKVFLGE
ncbi:MAG: DUF1819 family protein [Tissierella sp.]|uniref:DUF1819 family protein n=1 Tax=Tissierella sp. TaxID=41274 RepID=UPI003F9AED14